MSGYAKHVRMSGGCKNKQVIASRAGKGRADVAHRARAFSGLFKGTKKSDKGLEQYCMLGGPSPRTELTFADALFLNEMKGDF